MIHGVFISKKRKRERIYFPNMIRQGRNVKVMEGEKDEM